MPRRIDDHSFWAGSRSKNSVFPEGAKCKQYTSVDGAGELREYQDTSEAIQKNQQLSVKKIDQHKQDPQYRN